MTPDISASQVKELRDSTGAGMMDAKKALVEANGDTEKAIEILRTKGQAKASKRAGRDTGEGLVHSYLHAGGKIGVLIEVNCESDFVARTDDFKNLVHDLSMHIAAASPIYVNREEVPNDVLEAERRIYAQQAAEENKPAEIAERIAEGKLENFYKEICLLEQPFVKDSSLTIEELVTRAIATLGENIRINRFARFAIGE